MRKEILVTIEEVKEFFKDFNLKEFSWDTETTSLRYTELEITGISFYDGNNACYIPIDSYKNVNKKPAVNKDDIILFMKDNMLNCAEKGFGTKQICHNIVFDMMVLWKYDIDCTRAEWFDTMVGAHLINENLKEHGLKALTRLVLKREVTEFGEASGNDDHYTQKFYEYGMADAINTWDLYKLEEQKIKQLGLDVLMYRIEMPFQRALLEMKVTGVLIDKPLVEEITEKLKKEVFNMERDLYRLLKEPFSIQHSLLFQDMTIQGKINFGSPKQLSEILFNRLGLEVVETTPTGLPKTGKTTIEMYAKTHPFVAKLELYKIATKLLSGFFEPMPKFTECDDRIRPYFNDVGTKTGRLSCIAKGSKVQTVRDFSKYPEGTNIEDVKIGDYVYCQDKNNDLQIRKVKKVIYQGKQKCIKLNWNSLSNLKKGELILTPEHKVKNIEGEWIEAKNIEIVSRSEFARKIRFSQKSNKNSRLMWLHFQIYDYNFIYSYKHKKTKNIRFLTNLLNNNNKLHVHHKDKNKLNDNLNNLELMSKKQHAKLHVRDNLTKEAQLRGTKTMILMRSKGLIKYKSGYDNKNTIKLSKNECISIIRKHKGIKKNIIKGRCFYMFKRECINNGLDWNNLFLYTVKREDFINKLIETNNIYHTSNFFNIGFRRGKLFINYHNIKPEEWKLEYRNHYVSSIEDAGIHNVYDLEIESIGDEDTNNFFANEICVHNCSSPNCQQLPRKNKKFPIETRNCFIVPKGYKMISVDYSGQELRVMAHLSRDPTVVKAFNEGHDLHLATANKSFNLGIPDEMLKETHPDYEETKEKFKIQRQNAKSISFGLLYGIGPQKLSKEIGCSENEAKTMIEKYFAGYPFVKKAIDDTHTEVRERGYVRNIVGRYRRFSKIDGEDYYPASAFRQSFNFKIQGFSSDMIRLAAIKSYAVEKQNPQWDLKMIMTVHDEIVFQVKEEYVEEASKAVKEAFETVTKFVVPILADVESGNNYGEAK